VGIFAAPPAVVAKERPWAVQWDAFVQGLRALGWIENQNLVFESRYTEGSGERRTQLARELVALRPDVLVVTEGEPGIRALKEATTAIPIVMLVSYDPAAVCTAQSVAALASRGHSGVTRVAVLWLHPATGSRWKTAMLRRAP
jgi:putative ABC transport system substrate-binding protein